MHIELLESLIAPAALTFTDVDGDKVVITTTGPGTLTLGGQALGTPVGTDSFRFMAEKIGSLKIGGTAFPLTAGPNNLLVGTTGDLRLFDIA